MFLQEKIFWQKSLKYASEGIQFLVKLQAVGLTLSLILIFIFVSVTINVLPVAGLVHSVIA